MINKQFSKMISSLLFLNSFVLFSMNEEKVQIQLSKHDIIYKMITYGTVTKVTKNLTTNEIKGFKTHCGYVEQLSNATELFQRFESLYNEQTKEQKQGKEEIAD